MTTPIPSTAKFLIIAGTMLVASVLGAGKADASAIILSHNGTLDSTPHPGSGDVDVRLDCFAIPEGEDCTKTFNEIATHEIVWNGSTGGIEEEVWNRTGITWTDFHISLSGDFLFTGEDWISGLPVGTTIQGGEGFSDIWLLFGDSGFRTDSKFMFTFGFASQTGASPVTISQTPTIPEPATLALFGFGLLGLGAMRRRRNSAEKA